MFATPAPAPSPGQKTFADLVSEAAQLPRPSDTRTHALSLGFDETALLRYASGAVSTYERHEITNLVIRCEWARKFIVDHVKSRRRVAVAA